VKVVPQFHFAPGTIVVDYPGYNYYALFGRWTALGVYLATRMNENAFYEIVREKKSFPKTPVSSNIN
jgi:hypothetical protein